jgi:hypothetical protein
MRVYRDLFFWTSGAKFVFALLVGLGNAHLLLGVSVSTALAMAFGGILGFPAAFAFGAQRPRPTSEQLTH